MDISEEARPKMKLALAAERAKMTLSNQQV
jgi:hypothetical protein